MIKEEWRTKFDHTCQTYAQHIYREMQKKIQKLFRIIVMSARYIYYRLGIEIHTFVEKLLTLWLESLRKRSIVHRHTESSYLRDISEHKDGLHKTLE
ncbi:MAG: hypothetical protein COV70_03070 [Parcubacteria group bacterium CG11_big_fil_rev_8_21_14_0_20_39_22]|nr:MAG: hypothetical protein COV70_03070 [Parcubacteria group bacterium CG11_big_fil_rev_8_21_14_0_20_39_22]